VCCFGILEIDRETSTAIIHPDPEITAMAE
jgi:hypothetical protein